MEPETVVTELSRRGADRAAGAKRAPRRPARSSRRPRNVEAAHTK